MAYHRTEEELNQMLKDMRKKPNRSDYAWALGINLVLVALLFLADHWLF